jgi:hypothetical protein
LAAARLDIPISVSGALRREDIGLGRRFVSDDHPGRFFELRFELYNPFNQIVFPTISVGNPITKPTRNSNGELTGGFGFMNVNTSPPARPGICW